MADSTAATIGVSRNGSSARLAQRQVLAILLAIAAAVIPLAGAASAATFGGGGWAIYALSASGDADLISPILLIGALGIAAITDPARWDRGRLRLLGLVCAGAGIVLTLSYAGALIQIVHPTIGITFTASGSTSWGISRVSILVVLIAQVLLSLTATWFSFQLISSERRSRP